MSTLRLVHDPDAHHWSGWPGAICLKCRAEDPLEIAVADGVYDPSADFWMNEDAAQRYREASVCPVKGVLRWNGREFELEQSMGET